MGFSVFFSRIKPGTAGDEPPGFDAILLYQVCFHRRGAFIGQGQHVLFTNRLGLRGPERLAVRIGVDADRAAAHEARRALGGAGGARLPREEREERVARLLAEEGPRRSRELAEALGWSGSTVRSVLRGMVAEGVVERTRESARSPSQRYRLCR